MERVRIYQLFVRLFGNTSKTRKANGTLAENGCGKFSDINAAALASLKEMGFTHLWLTGVLRQATGTDYREINLPADDADLLKGLAGSPYAIKDYFDVCPDYAENPKNRMEEFKALLDRIHSANSKALIDFVPNHVARSYDSTVMPDSNFGAADDKTKFFDAKNNFYYLTPSSNGPPLRLPTVVNGSPVTPTCKIDGMHCDGLFDGEKEFGRATGNNAATWAPGVNDWYETVKLNYGWDFINNRRACPSAATPDLPLPDTWVKMDRIIAYWQSMGVDGFRCDMAHMVPQEFWAWAIGRARARNPDVYFAGEAYDNDPTKVPSITGNDLMTDLLRAGFDALYDDPSYKVIKRIYDGPSWANDIDATRKDDLFFHHALRYAENHDEVRLAARDNWGGIGMEVGRAVCGILFGLSRGPVMLYNGQEVGEQAGESAGFGGHNGRTSIFDYWSMPELSKWVNGHRYDGAMLSDAQKNLREFYKRLINLTGEPAFRDGEFFPLNPANNRNMRFGCLGNEPAGGHCMYAYLRHDAASKQRFLVVVNLNRDVAFENMPVFFPAEALAPLGIADTGEKSGNQVLRFTERLGNKITLRSGLEEFARKRVLEIPVIPPLTPCYFEITVE